MPTAPAIRSTPAGTTYFRHKYKLLSCPERYMNPAHYYIISAEPHNGNTHFCAHTALSGSDRDHLRIRRAGVNTYP